jgi:hypothetical protein
MSDVADADKECEATPEWMGAYRRGMEGPWRTGADVSSPPLSAALIAHFAYLDRLIAGIKELDTAQNEKTAKKRARPVAKWERTP